SQRERNLDCRAIRLFRLASEVEYLEIGNPGGLERARIGARVRAFQDQHRKAFARGDEVAVERADAKGPRATRRNLCGLADLEQLDERGLELHDAIVRAPGMDVACTDRKSEPAIEVARGIEVADDMHDMVDTLWQIGSLHRRERGRRKQLVD